ncbi:MAG: lytic transglycosylase domain-containing protein [Gemmatimonadota bacterium]
MDVENMVNRSWEPVLGWLRSCTIRATSLGARLTTPLGTSCLAVVSLGVGLAASGWVTVPGSPLADARERADGLEAQVQEAHVQLAHQSLQVERLRHVQEEAARHDIPVELASMVHDLALVEGMRPELAFRLVATESTFRQYAVSDRGAVGFTQIKPSTARLLSPDVTESELFDAETNLRLGFRYLRLLLERYDGNMRLALLAYNRGPTRVGTLLAMGRDPANGYARKILTTN